MKSLAPQGPSIPVATNIWWIVVSLLLGLMFNLLPWGEAAQWWRPDFVLVIGLFWVIHQPHRVGLGVMWSLGLLTDMVDGGMLGQHAIGYALAAVGALLLQRRLLKFNAWQQALQILPLLLLEKLANVLTATFAGHAFSDVRYLLSVLSGALLWIPVALLLQRARGSTGSTDSA